MYKITGRILDNKGSIIAYKLHHIFSIFYSNEETLTQAEDEGLILNYKEKGSCKIIPLEEVVTKAGETYRLKIDYDLQLTTQDLRDALNRMKKVFFRKFEFDYLIDEEVAATFKVDLETDKVESQYREGYEEHDLIPTGTINTVEDVLDLFCLIGGRSFINTPNILNHLTNLEVIKLKSFKKDDGSDILNNFGVLIKE